MFQEEGEQSFELPCQDIRAVFLQYNTIIPFMRTDPRITFMNIPTPPFATSHR
jgi:hypothetical protein